MAKTSKTQLRRKMVGLKLTADEYKDAELVRAARGLRAIAHVFHGMSLTEVRREARRLRRRQELQKV